MVDFCTTYLAYVVIMVPLFQSHLLHTALDIRQLHFKVTQVLFWVLSLRSTGHFKPFHVERGVHCLLNSPTKIPLHSPSPSHFRVNFDLYRVTDP
jgi:hypothetical protein